jgi:hypothetical protein
MRVMRTSSTAHATAASHSISSPAVESATYVMGRGLVDGRPAFVQAAAPDGGPQHGQPDPWKRLFASVAAMVDAVREKQQVQLAPWVTRRRAAAKAKAAVGGRAAVGRNVRRAAVERIDILKAELTPPSRPAKWAHFAFQHGLLLPSPPASLWPPAAERRLEAAVLIQDLSPAAPLWW